MERGVKKGYSTVKMVSEKWPGAFAVEKEQKQKSSLYNLSTLGSPGPLSSFHVKQIQSVV